MLDIPKLEMPERHRLYYFPGGEKLGISGVTHFMARPSGVHRLIGSDGKLHIVSPGWLHIEIDADHFSI